MLPPHPTSRLGLWGEQTYKRQWTSQALLRALLPGTEIDQQVLTQAPPASTSHCPPRPRFLPQSLESQEELAFSSDKPFKYFFPSLNVKANPKVLSSLVRSRLRPQGRKGRTRQDLEEGGAWVGAHAADSQEQPGS